MVVSNIIITVTVLGISGGRGREARVTSPLYKTRKVFGNKPKQEYILSDLLGYFLGLGSFRHDSNILVKLDEQVTRDDIHITSEKGKALYQFSIRKAMLMGKKIVIGGQAAASDRVR